MRLTLMILAGLLTASAQAAPVDDAKKFVNGFYRWYVQQNDGYASVLKQRPDAVDTRLLGELRQVAACEAQGTVEVCQDADPFLASQDPCNHYQVASATTVAPGVFRLRVVGDCQQAVWVRVIGTPRGFKIQRVNPAR